MKRLTALTVLMALATLGGSPAVAQSNSPTRNSKAWWGYWWSLPAPQQAKVFWDPTWFSAYSVGARCSSGGPASSFGPVRLYRGDDLAPSMTLPFVWRVGMNEAQTCTLGTGVAGQVMAFRRGRATMTASGTSPYIAGIECRHQTGLLSDQKISVPTQGLRTLTVSLSNGDMCWAYGDDHDPWFASGHRDPAPYSLGSNNSQCGPADPGYKNTVSTLQDRIVGFEGGVGAQSPCYAYFSATRWTRIRMLAWNDFVGVLSYTASTGSWSSGESCIVFNGQMLSCQQSGSTQPPPIHTVVSLETGVSQGSTGTWAVEYDGTPPRPA